MSDRKKPEIKVIQLEIPTDPIIRIFSVEITDGQGSWMEAVPTSEALHWFFRGLQAGGQMYGNTYIPLPEIPSTSVLLKI